MKMKILITFWIPQVVVDKAGDEFELIYHREETAGKMSRDEIKKCFLL